jgi:hypothetical protein
MELFFSLHEIFLTSGTGMTNLWHVYQNRHEGEWNWINIELELQNIYILSSKCVVIQW